MVKVIQNVPEFSSKLVCLLQKLCDLWLFVAFTGPPIYHGLKPSSSSDINLRLPSVSGFVRTPKVAGLLKLPENVAVIKQFF
jgi:hypothetical protein